MLKKVFLLGLAVFFPLTVFFATTAASAERLDFGSGGKAFHPWYLPMFAAEEKGFWEQNGLDVKWVPFKGSVSLNRSIAAGAINIALSNTVTFILGAERGLPAIIVSEVSPIMEFFIWVPAKSPIKAPKDLKGAKIGVTRMRAVSHAFGIVIAKSHGIEKDVKFVGTGGMRAGVAALQTNAIDAYIVAPFSGIVKLKLEGKVREMMGTRDYRPKEWTDLVVIARKDFIKNKPDLAKRAVKGFLQGVDFVNRNTSWSTAKIKSFEGLSSAVATWLIKYYPLTKDGKIERKAVENVRSFLIEQGIVTRDKTPPVEELFTSQFTG
jgi:ABC-type nitrate/sulfonate/bicarbonate transport system substrate-binding protein